MTRDKLQWSGGHLAAICVLTMLLATMANAEAQRRYVKDKSGQRSQPVVAVDNVCAWPNLTVLGDGTIAAVGFNKPRHGGIVGDIDCWASEDGGATWEKRGTPGPQDSPGTNRVNHAAGRANNGDLIVICSGTTNVNPPGPFEFLQPWISRSSDGGRTWSIDKRSAPTKAPGGEMWIPFGDILPGNDGALRMALYTCSAGGPRVDRVYILRSPDDGRTWEQFVPLDPDQLRNETALLHLGDGAWLAAARKSALHLYFSTDDAHSWQYRGPVTQTAQHPGHLLRLRDGRILLTYGNRAGSDRGVEVLVSANEGQTWSAPVRVCDWQGDGGYPSSVRLPDGQVLTAYYARQIKGHDRYHFGVVTWNPDSSLTP